MTESQKDDSGDAKAGLDSNQNSALGVVFTMVGVVFFLTMDNWAIGLPFVALGLAFFSMGIAATKKPRRPWAADGSAWSDGPPAP
ncbi:hypothetical protein [Marisediminicola senii]|uniref:hypothetical protein n=1 Tax=Marisediminicola senii TaxID=2711233 RepID=UPI0013EDA5F4|nr:hypothetical protein [Marisediminicola senii]